MARTLLIVDDVKSNREILKNMLGGDYQILEAPDGKTALAIMSEQYASISAVLLDLGMPDIDGYDVLTSMQSSEKLSQLPVIVTTGQTDAGSEERALKLGARDYISKPYKSAIIRQRIWNTINLRETAATVNALQRDRLTGLYSRDAFFEKVSEMASAHESGYYVMACCDVDKFKVINDQYGTDKGDEVLRAIANVFSGVLEPLGGLCCRVSSDDFAIFYPAEYRQSEQIEEMRRRASLVAGLASPIVFSIGQYLVSDTAMSPSAMYDRAMLAADSVKGRYDTRLAVYDESMRDRLLREQEIVTEMESALESGQFEVWYQPQYNHSSGAMIGAEALVRWRHPKKGMISPGEFVPVFEQNGFVYSLDRYVWQAACLFLRKELDAGRPALPVSVNISRYDVFRDDFVDFITGLVGRYSIPVELLRLEITESAFAESTEHIVSVVKRLVDFGFTLEIDDFGSGYSSLNTLKSVPAQVVKLDMRFLEDSDGSKRGGNIIESIVRMTKWLGMSVIAEGVERKAQADYLKSIGCNYVQGFLYAKPMPEEEYRKKCAAGGNEEKLLVMETVENLDNDSFWSPESMDTLIFNSYVGAACVYEFHRGHIELLRASEKYAQLIGGAGMSVEKALALDWMNYLSEDSKKTVVADLERLVKTKEEYTGEYVFIDLPGCASSTYLRSTMRVTATAGDRCLVYCINENITAQRTAERRERETSERLAAVMDNVACGITAVTFDGQSVNYILTNKKYYELLGYTERQYSEEVATDAFSTIYEEDLPLVIEMTRRVGATSKPETLEYRAVRRDGGIVWLRSIVSMASFEGVEGRVQLSTYTDITQRKRAELELLDTTAQLQTMMNDMPGGFARLRADPDGVLRMVYINEGFFELVGLNLAQLKELYGSDIFAGVHPDDVKTAREAIEHMPASGEAYPARYRMRRGESGYIWLNVVGRATEDTSGVKYLNLYYTDATEQTKSETRRRELLDNLPYGIALYEYDGKALSIIHLNKRYWELVDRRETEYADSAFLNAVYPDDRAVISRELESAIREQRDISCDIRVLCGEGDYRPFHIEGRVQRKRDGVYSIYAAYTPISDGVISVQQMLPIALSAMMDAQTDMAFVKDKNLRYVCCSREMARVLNLPRPEDMVGKTDSELFGADFASEFAAEDLRVINTGEAMLDKTARMPSRDGEARYAVTSKFPLKDSHGNVIGLYGTGRDITEARSMQTRLELLTNNIPGGIAIYEGTPDALDKIRVTYFSDGFCRLFGYTRAEYEKLADKNPLGLVFSEDISKMYEHVVALARDGVPMDYIYRAKTSSGDFKWINVKAVMGEPNGANMTVNAVFFDVTEHQKALEQLRMSEEENRIAMRHTRNAVCRYEVASGRLRIPESAQVDFALPEVVENVPEGPIEKGLISDETIETYREFYGGIRRGCETGEAVYQRMSAQGWRWIESRYSTIFSDSGAPVSAVISFSDVTEQLEKDSAYKKWQQSLLDKSPEAYSLFRCNISKKTTFDTREGSLLTIEFAPGVFDFDERTEDYVARCVLDEDRERFAAFLNADSLLSGYYQGKRIVSLEYREKLAGGDFRWLRLTVDLVEHSRSTDVEAYMLFEDIDKAKRLELATLELAETDPLTGVMNRAVFSARVNALIQTSKPGAQHALMMLDIDGFKLVNDVFGHGAGDEALIDIAGSLRTALRHGDLVGRLGGDEFLVFLADIPSDAVAATKAKQICALTRKAFSASVEISGSVGIALIPRDGENFDTLYKKADAALYHVKGAGKDSYAFYQYGMTSERPTVADAPVKAGAPLKREKKRRMLIVDDSRMDHALMTSIFADDFIIEKAKDGAAALARLRHYGSAIAVVLLDLMMPVMDGFAVLAKMQESPELRNIPVIAVSGDDNRETAYRAIREGAVDFVSKPIETELLRIRVRSAISKAENERLRAQNCLLEYQNGEVVRYRTALEHSGIIVIENDWVAGTFIYDEDISKYLAGSYDSRSLWHVLLSDLVAETKTVKEMQELVLKIATDKKRSEESMTVRLKTPSGARRLFRLNVYKIVNEFGLAGKIYLTLADLDREEIPEQTQRPPQNNG